MSGIEEIPTESAIVKDENEFDVEADGQFDDDFVTDPNRYIFYRYCSVTFCRNVSVANVSWKTLAASKRPLAERFSH